jgi:hypothetical protein
VISLVDVVHPGYRYGVPQDSPRESSFTRRVAARSGGYGGHAGVRCNRTRHRGYNVVVTTLTCMYIFFQCTAVRCAAALCVVRVGRCIIIVLIVRAGDAIVCLILWAFVTRPAVPVFRRGLVARTDHPVK